MNKIAKCLYPSYNPEILPPGGGTTAHNIGCLASMGEATLILYNGRVTQVVCPYRTEGWCTYDVERSEVEKFIKEKTKPYKIETGNPQLFTKVELKFLEYLLNAAEREFSNHSCSSIDDNFLDSLSFKEKEEMQRRYKKWYSPLNKVEIEHAFNVMDTQLVAYFSDRCTKIREEME